MREFEKDIKKNPDYQATCYAEEDTEPIVCRKDGFWSILNILDSENLEEASDAEI